MISIRKPRALLGATALTLLIGLGGTLLPTAAFADAHDHAAPIQAADSSGLSQMATDSSSLPVLYSSSGEPVMANAWCDPVDHTCDQHPWIHHDTRH